MVLVIIGMLCGALWRGTGYAHAHRPGAPRCLIQPVCNIRRRHPCLACRLLFLTTAAFCLVCGVGLGIAMGIRMTSTWRQCMPT